MLQFLGCSCSRLFSWREPSKVVFRAKNTVGASVGIEVVMPKQKGVKQSKVVNQETMAQS